MRKRLSLLLLSTCLFLVMNLNAEDSVNAKNGFGGSKNQGETIKRLHKLEALISKQQEEYKKRPKRKFFGQKIRDARWKEYLEDWSFKVESIGNMNYPAEAKNNRIHGKLQATVEINSDGSLRKVRVNRSSGHKILDNSTKEIVKLSAPFAEFPKKLKSEADIISITRTWTFTKYNTVNTH